MKMPRSHPHHGRRISMGGRDVVAFGLDRHYLQDIYFYAMTSSWTMFFFAAAVVYLIFNMVFAGLYALGDHPVANLTPDNFLGYFFFSVETLATVGYGNMHPQTVYAHVISSVEIFIGMASVALTTGVMFARFSRPRSNIIFADHPVCHMVDGRRLLMIRLANARMNIISEASAKLRLVKNHASPETGSFRKILDLELERDHHPIFSLGWTVIHVIDESSPLYGYTKEQLNELNAALVLSIEGLDEMTNQSQRARHYYPCSSIRWNHRYVDILKFHGDTPHLHYAKFHESENLDDIR
ncbi:Inward rectifier potassium channel [Undibacterium sp. FT147W]|uniref:Inward rectifier potassium channel n=1 Tax=Undibacterium rivi TaxID=2828729 RepID=A0ABS5GZC1_9BURK|nr:ion channel [Undibacterium rivi]MBR7791805.1 Inward rectifier potassium channel [Undibacterium rivi]